MQMRYKKNFLILTSLIIPLLFQIFSVSLLFSEEIEENPSPAPFMLTIETALSRALNYNRQLQNTLDNTVRAEYQLEVANSVFEWDISPNSNVGYVGGGSAGSGIACGTGIDFSKQLKCGTTIDIMPSFEKIAKTYQTNMRTRITTPLLRGWGTEYTLSAVLGAQYGLRSASRAKYIAQCQLVMRTITTLYELIKTYKNVLLNQESYQRMVKFYQTAKLKAQIGLAEPLDIYRAETEMRTAEDALTSSRERFQEIEDNLRDILALPPDMAIMVNIPVLHNPIQMTLDDAIETALANRVEIDQASDQVQEDRRLSRVAKERLWPELNLVVNYSNCGLDQVFTECLTTKRQTTWGVGLTTSSDFDPVAEKAAYDQSLIAVASAVRNVDQVKSNIIFEVKKTMRHLERSIEKIALQEKQIHTARGELRLSQIKFDRGMANNFDMIQAEKTLRSSELTYWNAIIEHIVAEYQILNVIGLLMEKPCLTSF